MPCVFSEQQKWPALFTKQEHQLICQSNCADYGDHPLSSPSSAVISCGLSPSLRNYIPSSSPGVPICAKNTFTTKRREMTAATTMTNTTRRRSDLTRAEQSRCERHIMPWLVRLGNNDQRKRREGYEWAVLVDDNWTCGIAEVVRIPNLHTYTHYRRKAGMALWGKICNFRNLVHYQKQLWREKGPMILVLKTGKHFRSGAIDRREIGPINYFIRYNSRVCTERSL